MRSNLDFDSCLVALASDDHGVGWDRPCRRGWQASFERSKSKRRLPRPRTTRVPAWMPISPIIWVLFFKKFFFFCPEKERSAPRFSYIYIYPFLRCSCWSESVLSHYSVEFFLTVSVSLRLFCTYAFLLKYFSANLLPSFSSNIIFLSESLAILLLQHNVGAGQMSLDYLFFCG